MKFFIPTFILSIAASIATAQPVNDNPCGAVAISPTTTCSYTTYNSAGATATAGVPAPGCASYTTGDVWFSVVVPANGQFTADLSAGTITDSGLALYTASGSCPSSLSLALVACDDDSGAGSMSQLTATCLNPGSTVYLRVWDYTDGTGTFGICVTSPNTTLASNNEPCNAIPLTVTSACNYIATSNATATANCAYAAPSCSVGAVSSMNDIWYSAVVPSNGILVFDSSPGTLTNAGVAFYTGSCSALTFVACNDNGSHAGLSMPYLYKNGLTPGATVYVRIWGQSSTTGTFGFCVSTPPTSSSSVAASDFCHTATPICDFNGYNGNTSSVYTTAGPRPNDVNGSPSQFCGTIENNSWLRFTAGAATASFNVFVTNCTNGDGIQMAMYSTNCTSGTGSFTLVSNCVNSANNATSNPNGFVITANSLVPGNQYVMMIDGYANDVCTYTIGANAGVDVISIASSVPSKILCPGSSATLSVDAVGTGPFTYNWGANPSLNATNTANPTATPTATTTYTVTVTGGNCGASQTASVTLTVANPTLTITPTNASCGAANGSAVVVASAISGVSYSYLWSAAAQTTATATNLAANIYSVTVTTTGGCTKTATTTIGGSTPPTITISGSNLFCTGSNTTVTASGGTSYAWSSGAATAANTVSTVGTYTVTATNSGTGCTATAAINIGENPLPTPTLSAGSLTCSNPTTTLSAGGGAPYIWSANTTSQAGATAVASAPSVYTVTVTHSNGCTASITLSVTQSITPPVVSLLANGTITCSNTSVDLTATNGSTYTWSGNTTAASGATAIATAGGIYTVTATNSANGCTASRTVSVAQNTTAPTVSLSTLPSTLTCATLTTTVTASGGTSYLWSTNASGNIVSGINTGTVTIDAPATYTVVANNSANGCTASTTVAVMQNSTPPTPSIAAPATLTCSLLSTSLTASGGNSYTWSSNVVSSSGATASVNAPAMYVVTATAANGCTASATLTVMQNIAPPTPSASNSGNPCPASTLSLSASGGASYAWSGPNSYSNSSQSPTVSSNATAAMMGTYTVTVTGSNGCTATATTAVSLLAAPTTNTPTKTCNVAGTFYTYRFNLNGTPTPSVTDNGGIGGTISGGAFISNNIPIASLPTFTVTNSCGSVAMTPPNTPCATTFDCSGTTGCFGSNLVTNAGFESGNTNFTHPALGYNGTCTPGSNACNSNLANSYYSGTTNDILCQGTYGVDANVRQCNKFWSPNIRDHTSGTGKMMLIDFPSSYNAANNKLWCQNITLATNMDYCFGAYFINLVPSVNSAFADPSFGFSLGGVGFTNTIGVSEDEQWHSYGVQFHNNVAGTYELCINNLNAGTTGFDVAIDDISIKTINTGTIPSTTNDIKILCAGASSVVIPVLANDSPGAGSLDFSSLKITTTPAFNDGYISSINTTTGAITFTPYSSFDGSANFEYQICNTTGCCATAMVTVNSGSNPTATLTATGGNAVCQGSSKIINLSSVTGGSGSGYSYAWNNAATTTSTTVSPTVSPTTYTATVTDGAGCSVTSSISININALPTLNAIPNIAICNTTTTALNASATGGSGSGYSYNWSDAGANPHNVNPSSNTTYSVTVTDNNGCTNTTSTQLTVRPLPTANIAPVSAICRNSSATLSASATGGSTVFTSYTWDNALGAGTTKSVTPPATTIYNVTVTDSNGCTDSENITVVINQLPAVDAGVNRAICAGGSTTLNATGSSGSGASYTYNWSSGLGAGSSKTVSPASTTSYNVTITDGNNCTSSTSVTITVNAVTPATLSSYSPQFCTGQSTTITANGAGTFNWSTGANTQSITVNTVGTFTATVTDGNGCLSTASATTIQNALPTPSVSPVVSSFCSGGSTTISVLPFTNYNWSNGQTAQSITVTTGGIYTVTVTDGNGCTATGSRNVVQYALPNFTLTGTPAFCRGSNTTFSVSGATGNYAWSNAATTSSTVVNSAGNYTVTVTNSNGCSSTRSVSASVNPLPNPSITGNGSFCFGGNSLLDAGSFSSYQWSNTGGIISGATIQTYSATQAGSYTVQVTNSFGCSASDSRTITQNSNIVPNISGVSAICAGTSTDIDAGSYNNYAWSTGVNGQATITVTTAGIYTVTVTDLSGCTGTNSITITSNANPTVAINNGAATAFCTGSTVNLSATVTPALSGASSGYTWSNGFSGASTNSVSVNSPGAYLVTVTDSNGCTASSNVTVVQNALPAATINGSATAAVSYCLTATLTASGGSGTFNYAWSNAATTAAINLGLSPMPAAIYTVTVTNSTTLCSNTATTSITVNPKPSPVITTTTGTNAFCAGSAIGLGLTTTGGLVAYEWRNGTNTIVSTVANYSATLAGTYTVKVTNTNGCTGTASIAIIQNTNPTPSINAGASAAAYCQSSNVLLTASGGNTYLWNTGSTGATLSVNSANIYTVTVTNSSTTCTASRTISVTQNALPTAVISGTTAYCAGNNTTITASGAGTGGSAGYVWSTTETTAAITISGTPATVYTVTVTDTNGCTATRTITITQNANPIATISNNGSPIAAAFCVGKNLTLTTPAGMTSYAWSNTGGAISGAVNNSYLVNTAGVYTVVITNNNGCTGSASLAIAQSNNPSASITTTGGAVAVCAGNTITLTGNTGIGLNYVWNTGATSSSINIAPLNTADYTVTVTNAQGCTDIAIQNIVLNTLPTPNITGTPNYCAGSSTVLTASGGNSYAWSVGGNNAANTINSSIVGASTYTVTVTSSQNCSTISTISVTVNPTPTATITTAGNSTAFCANSTLILTAPSGATTYAWSDGTSGQTLTASNGGNYSVIITNSSSCSSSSAVTLTQNAVPTAIVSTTGNATAVCAGNSITLTANTGTPAFTYAWNTGASMQSISPTPSLTTVYTVTVTIPTTGCTASTTQTITYNTRPTAAITGTNAYCTGSSTILSGSGGDTYLWNTTATTAAATLNNATVGTSIYTVTVTTAATGCTSSSTAAVTVYARPTITISGATSFCTGSNFTLTAPAGLLNYQWSSTSGTIAGATNNSYTTNTANTYTVVAANNQLCTATASIGVSANSLPVADINSGAATTAFCQGSSGAVLTLSGGASGAWTGGLTANSITVTNAGTYIVTVTNAQNCTATDVITVAENTLPTPMISGAATTCGATSTTLDAGSGFASYNWSTSPSFTPSLGTMPNLAVNATNTYYVRVVDANGCSNSTSYSISQFSNPSPSISSSNGLNICNTATNTLTANNGYNYYLWSDGTTGASATAISVGAAGTYTVTVTATGGCTGTQAITLNAAPLPEPSIGGNSSFCSGSNTNLTATGGLTGTYTYAWSTSSSNQTINVNTVGQYTVTATSSSGCTASTNVTVTQNALPQVAISGNATYCSNSIGTILTATGGTLGTFSYVWNTGANAANLPITSQTIGAPTTYTVTVRNTATTCSATATYTVTQLAQPTTTIVSTSSSNVPNSFCAGTTATLTAASGLSGYQWSFGGSPIGTNTNVLTATNPGVYQVVIANSSGCTNTASLTLTENALPTATITNTTGTAITNAAFCQGGNVTVTATGGDSYIWNNGTPSASLSVNQATTYTVTATNSNGCTASTPILVTQNALPTPVISTTSTTTCTNTTTTLGLTGNYTAYLWSSPNPGATTATVSVSATGNYYVTVTDTNNCSNSASIYITQNLVPVPTIGTTPTGTVVCTGSSLNLAANTGYQGYTWSNGATTTSTNVTVGGIYTVTVTSADGCTGSATLTITAQTPPTAAAVITGNLAYCAGSNTTLSAGNATTYTWSNGGQVSQTINVSLPNTYTVTVSDVYGCTASTSVTVTQNALPQAAISGDNTYCTNTTAMLSASFTPIGTGSFSWNTGSISASITVSGAPQNPYIVTVTNAAGCSATASKTITRYNAPTLTAISSSNSNQVVCGTTGNITLLAGVGFIGYQWSNITGVLAGQTNSTYTANTANTYTVRVTDAQGCTAMQSITIGNATNPTAAITTTVGQAAFCPGATVVLTATGTGTYTWNTSSTQASITAGTAGLYTVTVTTAQGCTASSTVLVSAAQNPTPSVQGVTSICIGSTTTLDAGAGYATYQWANGATLLATTQTQAVTTQGTYYVTVTNAAGCQGVAFANVQAFQGPTVSINPSATGFCAGGSVSLTATNGMASYLWNNAPAGTTDKITVTRGGTYTVQVSNGQQCTAIATITITEFTLPTVTLSGPTEFCNGGSINLLAAVSPPLGTGSGGYAWSGGGTSPVKNFTTGGTYTVTVTDGRGCKNTASHVVIRQNVPNANAGNDFEAYPGEAFTLNANGGLSYQWNNNAAFRNSSTNIPNPTATIQNTTTFTVTVTDSNGCTSSDEVVVGEGQVLKCLGESEGVTPNNDGHNDTWTIGCLQYFENSVEVFNRWGQLIFSATNYDSTWDCTYNGSILPDGTYYYIIRTKNKDGGNGITYKGNLTVLR